MCIWTSDLGNDARLAWAESEELASLALLAESVLEGMLAVPKTLARDI